MNLSEKKRKRWPEEAICDTPRVSSLVSSNTYLHLVHSMPPVHWTRTVLLSGTIAPFTHFSLFFPSFRSLTHIPLSRPVTSLFILIFHPLPHACTRDIQPTRCISLFSLLFDHVINHLIAMCLPHGFVVTDPIAPSQSVLLLVSMFVLCWKPNMVHALCVFSIYILPPP